MSREQAEESEEEENVDDIVLSKESDGEESEKMAVVDEELAAVEEPVRRKEFVRMKSSSATNDDDNVDVEADVAEGEHSAADSEDEVEVKISRKVSRPQPSTNDGEEPEADTQIIDEDEIRPVVTYGRRATASSSSGAPEGDAVVDSDTEAPIAEPVKKSKPKSSNALYRLGLEEEARRHRMAKKNSLMDDEAEEEEEEGVQAGLGDFGFGVMSKNKENDEERVS